MTAAARRLDDRDCPHNRPPPSLLALLALLVVILLYPGQRSPISSHAPREDEVWLSECMRKKLRRAADGEAPWLAVYGDSLSRGVFFDTVELLNGSMAANPEHVHPGHNANYSADCTVMEARPPLRRQKCGGFAFDWRWPSSAADAHGRVTAARTPAGGDFASPVATRAAVAARLSFRLKTFAWEPAFDEAWLRALRRGRRLPDALLLSFGIWDMQYPPDESPRRGVDAFLAALTTFLSALEDALAERPRARPRLLWLSVTAVADAQLPLWKRPRMSARLARRYNELALPLLRRHGVQYVDTHSSGAEHPELSRDGVHFDGSLSRHHSRAVWEALCGAPPARRSAATTGAALARRSGPRQRARHGEKVQL